MKTKKKMMAFVQIAIVLCSLFLVAIPAIAAEQTTQKASTGAWTYTPRPFIYGDATEDGTVDMGDVIYIKLAIFGKKSKTELCDAKYDGRINVLDVIQTKLIILGKEKEITIVDGAKRVMTVNQPVERTIPLINGFTGFLYELGAGDTIVGVRQPNTQYYYPQAKDLPNVGQLSDLDFEVVVELQPDVVFTLTNWMHAAEPLVKLGIPVIALPMSNIYELIDNVWLIGTVVDKHKEAEAIATEMEATFSIIAERTKDIPEGDRPLVYVGTGGRTYGAKSYCTESINLAGGINIYGHLPVFMGQTDPEYVITKNPDFIFIFVSAKDRQEFIETAKNRINDVKNLRGWSQIDAVRNNRFCVIDNHYLNFGPDHPTSVVAMAKMLHPDLFTDLQFGEWVYVAGGEE